jgi:hypothetical protein
VGGKSQNAIDMDLHKMTREDLLDPVYIPNKLSDLTKLVDSCFFAYRKFVDELFQRFGRWVGWQKRQDRFDG